MSVYVDGASNAFGRMLMCHMLADTLEELHDMADQIGMKRKWFQPRSFPHYDLSKSKRKLAIENGAIEIDNTQVVELMKRVRSDWSKFMPSDWDGKPGSYAED